MIKNRTILQGDVLEKLAELPDESIDVIITSPPYWGLRDYGTKGQWGLESDFREYLEKMRKFMFKLKRVLKKTGTCWINLGDTYAGGNAHSDWSNCTSEFIGRRKETEQKFKAQVKDHLQAKSQYGIPQRFYAQCIDDNWIARNFIPWIKANSMPSSVKDRFTNKWEPIMFFAKNQKYYFNLDAIREKPKTETKSFNVTMKDSDTERFLQKALDGDAELYNEKEERTKFHGSKNIPLGSNGKPISTYLGYKKQDSTLGPDGKPLANYKGFNDRWKEAKEKVYGDDDKEKRLSRVRASVLEKGSVYHESGKNPGDIFFINPRPFPEAHFATFPVNLPLKILKCACPENGIVLDPFFGAGTVGVAAEKLGLNWVGIELKQEYIDIARRRLYSYLNQKLIF